MEAGVTVSVGAQPAEASGVKKAPTPNLKTKKRKPNTPAPDGELDSPPKSYVFLRV